MSAVDGRRARLRTAAYGLGLALIAVAVRWPFRHNPGYQFDSTLYRAWANSATQVGLGVLYFRQDYNYPPVFSYVLLILGHIQLYFWHHPFQGHDAAELTLVKLPAIVSDAAISATLFLALRARLGARLAAAAGLAYALNPATVLDSAIWGQVDSVVALPMLLSMVFLIRRRPAAAAGLLTLAILTKFQAIILVPVLAVALLQRREWRDWLSAGLAAAGTAFVVLLPVIAVGDLQRMAAIYRQSAGQFPFVSTNAFNLWWLVAAIWGQRAGSVVLDSDPLLGPLSYKLAALSLFALAALAMLLLVHRRRLTEETVAYAAGGLVLAFFTLAPEMHERYLFPAIPLLLLGFGARQARVLAALLSTTVFLNLAVVLWGEAWLGGMLLALISLDVSVVNLLALVSTYRSLARCRPDPEARLWRSRAGLVRVRRRFAG